MRLMCFIFCLILGASVPSTCFSQTTCCDSLGGCDSPFCDDLGLKRSRTATWSAEANALFLNSETQSSRVLGFNTTDPTESLSTSDLDFGIQSGFELALRREACDGTALELKYFGIDGWDAQTQVATTNGDLLQFNLDPPVFVTAGNSLTAIATSDLHSAEFNLFRPLNNRIDLLAGLRYLELDESGLIDVVGAGVPTTLTARTSNRLYGVQVGGDANLFHGTVFSLDAFGKVGLYGNHASQVSQLISIATLTAADDNSVASFVGEMGFKGSVALTERLSLQGGYRLFWVDGVALATEQTSTTTNSGIQDAGSVFYHGAQAGLAWSF